MSQKLLNYVGRVMNGSAPAAEDATEEKPKTLGQTIGYPDSGGIDMHGLAQKIDDLHQHIKHLLPGQTDESDTTEHSETTNE